MSDFFDNLVVRSFRPLLPVQPLDAPLLAPMTEAPRIFARAAPEEFEDPFAEAAVIENETADEPDPGSIEHSPGADTKPRPPITTSRASSEVSSSEADSRRDKPLRSVESSPTLKPAAPRDQRIPDLPDQATSTPKVIPPYREELPVGKPLQPSVDHSLKSSTARSKVSYKEVSRSKLRPSPVKKSNSPLPPGSSAERGVEPRNKPLSQAEERPLQSSRRVSPPEHGDRATLTATERVVVKRITATVEKERPAPAPLTTLVPRPGTELLIPSSHKTRSNLLHRSEDKSTEAEAPPSETIINVTIGRIEVRATAPKAQTERQRNAPHVMNLDEYARQRSGGSR